MSKIKQKMSPRLCIMVAMILVLGGITPLIATYAERESELPDELMLINDAPIMNEAPIHYEAQSPDEVVCLDGTLPLYEILPPYEILPTDEVLLSEDEEDIYYEDMHSGNIYVPEHTQFSWPSPVFHDDVYVNEEGFLVTADGELWTREKWLELRYGIAPSPSPQPGQYDTNIMPVPEPDTSYGYGQMCSYEHRRFRPLFYDMPFPFAELVGLDNYLNWQRSRTFEERENESAATGFIRYFGISREDFSRANDELLQIWIDIGVSPQDSSMFEVFNVDVIFTFDNDIINEFFLWENSPIASERHIVAG